MMDWQKRVVEEKRELDEKIGKLDKFLSDSMTVKILSSQDMQLMIDQREHMGLYRYVLGKRIHGFTHGGE